MTPGCPFNLCDQCCEVMQLVHSTSCAVHVPAEHHDHHDDAGVVQQTGSNSASATDTFTPLSITNPKLLSCPRSVVHLHRTSKSALLLLIAQKVETWCATHSKFRRDVEEVEAHKDSILAILESNLPSQDPATAAKLLATPMRRLFGLTYMRSHHGLAGLRVYEERLRGVAQDPADQAHIFQAAAAAGVASRRRMAQQRAAEEADGASGRGGGRGQPNHFTPRGRFPGRGGDRRPPPGSGGAPTGAASGAGGAASAGPGASPNG